jgi:hypothetical protein
LWHRPKSQTRARPVTSRRTFLSCLRRTAVALARCCGREEGGGRCANLQIAEHETGRVQRFEGEHGAGEVVGSRLLAEACGKNVQVCNERTPQSVEFERV